MFASPILSLCGSVLLAGTVTAEVTLRNYPFDLSPLSPLFTYSPASAWTFDSSVFQTGTIGASVSISYMGHQLDINGRADGVSSDYEPDFENGIRPMEAMPPWEYRQVVHSAQSPSSSYLLGLHEWTGTLSSSSLEKGGPPFMNVTGARIMTLLPSDEADRQPSEEEKTRQGQLLNGTAYYEWYSEYTLRNESVVVEPAVLSDNTTNGFFRDAESAWSIIEAPTTFNLTGGLPNVISGPNDYVLDPEQGRYVRKSDSGTVFPTTNLLSTKTPNALLRFTAPENASLLQWYGSVGEDQGEFGIRLIPREEGGEGGDLGLHGMSRRASANRPVSAVEELMMIAWLDPKVRYDVEIGLLEEGKRVDLHGMVFVSFVRNASALDSNWVKSYNDSVDLPERPGGSGLSGGQIAGIVVGSVAGVALIVVSILVWRRRSKGKQAAKLREEQGVSKKEAQATETA